MNFTFFFILSLSLFSVSHPGDTSNFDSYPDSVEEAPTPVYAGRDPFVDF